MVLSRCDTAEEAFNESSVGFGGEELNLAFFSILVKCVVSAELFSLLGGRGGILFCLC